MKRYNLMLNAMPPEKPDGRVVASYEPFMIEKFEGEWVKHEDAIGLVVAEESRISAIYERRIQELKKQPFGVLKHKGDECNCDQMVCDGMETGKELSWVCPAHGYKRL